MSLARSAAALTATIALVSPSAALAQTSIAARFGGKYGLSATAPPRLRVTDSSTTAGDGLPKTGIDILPEALLGAAIVAAGAGLRTAGTGKPGG